MTLVQNMKTIRDAYGSLQSTLRHNAKLIDIHEGNLLAHVLDALARQLSPQSFEQCKERIAPINILRKLIDKMSPVYQPAPARRVIGTPQDEELFAWYQSRINTNGIMQEAAETLSLCKAFAVQALVHNGSPKLRVLPNDRFFVLSGDQVDPMTPTHLITVKTEDDGTVKYTAYSDDEFLIFDDKNEIQHVDMAAVNNFGGINPYGVLPFVYETTSRRCLMPRPDSDLFAMTVLIPLLFSDLNYATMFQAFSIMYGINVDDEGLKMAPNAFWRFKTDDSKDGKPEIGVIKPSVDIQAVLTLIETQLSLWLNSRGVRPGAVGNLTKDSFASGISKMIDEMDTSELRERLVDRMTAVETRLWNLIMHKLHPVWVQQGVIDTAAVFSPDAQVELTFLTQMPMISRGQIVADLNTEVAAGFISRTRAIKTLNPLMSDKEVEELKAEIDADKHPAADPRSVAVGEQVQ